MRVWTKLCTTGAFSAFALALAAMPVHAEDAPAAATEAAPEAASAGAKETVCNDGKDDDGDGNIDCADADCYDQEICQKGDTLENTNKKCSDWVDNDADGKLDCDDPDCQADNVTICKGSWRGKLEGTGAATKAEAAADEEIPELGEGMSVEDLIGTGGDIDGERSDQLCSDGIDNDGDGKVDCADFGCRFDPAVAVCRGSPGVRFSVVGVVQSSLDIQRAFVDNLPEAEEASRLQSSLDTRFSVLQLRALGPVPLIQDSFFLLSARMEKTPRLTFAMFQMPIGGGHFMNINSGGGGLSMAPILSVAKNPFINRAYYMTNAFEQGNGAAAEVFGPLVGNFLQYRAYVGGGAGVFNGNIGGRYFTYDNTNFTYSVGGQLIVNPFGNWNRWDSGMLYTKVPLTFGMQLGAKYDQRAQERYPAANVMATLRWGRLITWARTYAKYELDFQSFQYSYNAMAGFLIWPKHLFAAADFGQYVNTGYGNPPEQFQTDLQRQRAETQARGALHWYFYKNIGVLSAVYTYRTLGPRPDRPDDGDTFEQDVTLNAQFRW